jgi:aromatic ring-opening dioxygenase catalytic subunit (LigB family)
MTRQPTLYIPHGGGPCFFMDWNPPDLWKPMEAYLRGLAASLPERPRAILVISAHWETEGFRISDGGNPDLIYDYYGFPPHTYQLKYPAPGDPALAETVRARLVAAGFAAEGEPDRGYDHGVFIPFLCIFPEADIPILQLSLDRRLDPELHLKAGAALAGLRDEGVLIVGSGMSFHNMGAFRDPGLLARRRHDAVAFDDWLRRTVETKTGETRNQAIVGWTKAPGAAFCHPPGGEEHLLPFMVAAGAGQGDAGQIDFSDVNMHVSGCRFG